MHLVIATLKIDCRNCKLRNHTMSETSISLTQPEIDYLRFNSYVSDDFNLIYVSTPKVGCTSMKWWFAELVGVADKIGHSADSVETDPELIIHDCFAKIAPDITHKRAEIITGLIDSGKYFTFALVRNPFKRIFSAWQSKLLLREPYQSNAYQDKDFFNLPVESKEQVSIAFEAFLEFVDQHEAPDFKDVHWTPQFNLLRPDKIKYSYLGKIEEVDLLDAALRERIGNEYSSPFRGKRANESLLPFSDQFISPRACELIRKLYKKDFIEFGYSEELPVGVNIGVDVIATVLHAVQMIRARHQRFSDVQSRLSTIQGSLPAAEEEIASRDNELNAYRSQADEFARQVSALQASLSAAEGEIARLVSSLNQMQAQRENELSSWKFLTKQMVALLLNTRHSTNKSS